MAHPLRQPRRELKEPNSADSYLETSHTPRLNRLSGVVHGGGESPHRMPHFPSHAELVPAPFLPFPGMPWLPPPPPEWAGFPLPMADPSAVHNRLQHPPLPFGMPLPYQRGYPFGPPHPQEGLYVHPHQHPAQSYQPAAPAAGYGTQHMIARSGPPITSETSTNTNAKHRRQRTASSTSSASSSSGTSFVSSCSSCQQRLRKRRHRHKRREARHSRHHKHSKEAKRSISPSASQPAPKDPTQQVARTSSLTLSEVRRIKQLGDKAIRSTSGGLKPPAPPAGSTGGAWPPSGPSTPTYIGGANGQRDLLMAVRPRPDAQPASAKERFQRDTESWAMKSKNGRPVSAGRITPHRLRGGDGPTTPRGITVRGLKGPAPNLTDVVDTARAAAITQRGFYADASLAALQQASTAELEQRMIESSNRAAQYLDGMDQLYHKLQQSYNAFQQRPEAFLQTYTASGDSGTGQRQPAAANQRAAAPQQAKPLSQPTPLSRSNTFSRQSAAEAFSPQPRPLSHSSSAIEGLLADASALQPSSSTSKLREELERLERQWQHLSVQHQSGLPFEGATAAPSRSAAGSTHEGAMMW